MEKAGLLSGEQPVTVPPMVPPLKIPNGGVQEGGLGSGSELRRKTETLLPGSGKTSPVTIQGPPSAQESGKRARSTSPPRGRSCSPIHQRSASQEEFDANQIPDHVAQTTDR